jgi:menaquinone-dependent protoporphyrinogen IX oxidase
LAYIAVIAFNLLINAYFFGQNIFRNLVMRRLVPLVMKLKEKVFTKKSKVEDVA